MHRRTIARVVFALGLLLAFGALTVPAPARTTHLSRIFYIMMENQGFDDVIGHENANYAMDTPFITSIALKYGLQTLTFGTTHPSLPNYLSLIGGDYYGIQDDNPSCFAQPPQKPCDTARGQNLVDQLEAKHLTWVAFEQSMPSAGWLGPQFPPANKSGSGPTHYAQKHNPFVYFRDIATNSARLKNIVPLNRMGTLEAALANPATAPNFVFIVPDQCHDMHGSTDCPSGDKLLVEGDKYVAQLVTIIMKSKAYTPDSAIVVAWDENDYSSSIGCCGSVFPHGGGHTALIVITPRYSAPMESALPSNHYTELRSIEDLFGLPHIGWAAKEPPTLMDLLP